MPLEEIANMLPEVSALRRSKSLIRIPPAQDVPVTPRVQRIIDSAPMRRLASISQLGMVALVYPGATHSRFEHSLGVYHNAVRLLSRFDEEGFITETEAEAFLLAALLHDAGHWPFCHPIEDMRLSHLGEHETRLSGYLASTSLSELLASDWNCDADQVCRLLDPPQNKTLTDGETFLVSCMSGPLDVDKLDYLQRDSLHAGVPYGQNFDAGRLINSLCRHPETGRLAISEKGRTAAEMMVFARYVMFSEVYWHHAVRSATAMLQRSVFLLQNRIDLESTLRLGDSDWISGLRRAAEGTVAETMVEGLFGAQRHLFKRASEYSVLDADPTIHQSLARRPYWWLVACSEKLATLLSDESGLPIHPEDVLIDAPPVKLEVDINIDVIARDQTRRTLGEVSPVASVLANQQFDNHVKRVRIFVRPELRKPLAQSLNTQDWGRLIQNSIQQIDKEIA
ncbi:HD domain-containing protein [Rubripirellula amarantea]|nr:HD domain-containing protein [Rubripirellula amarantea]